MNAVFSLWTGTPSFRLDHNEALVATLSVALANRHMPVDFHTDERGFEIAHQLGWNFRNIYQDLDYIPDSAAKEVWCYGKLFVLSQAIRPTIHIDLDVLLYRPFADRLITGPLVAQSVDIPHYYQSPDIERCLELCGLSYEGRAFNAGIIGGSNVKALNKFAKEAMELADRFKGLGLDPTSASMVVEQFYFGHYAHENGIKVQTLFRGIPTQEQAALYGYNHLHGDNKRNPLYVAKVVDRLAADFPGALEKFKAGWDRLQQEKVLPEPAHT